MDELTTPEVSSDQLYLQDQLGEAPRWPARYGIFALITAFGAVIFFGGYALAPVITISAATDTDLGSVAFLMSALVQDTAFVLSGIGFASVTQPLVMKLFGLRRVRVRKALVWMGVAVLIYLPLEITLVSLLGDGGDEVTTHISAFDWVMLGFAIVALAPVAEEFLFRGFIFQSFRNRMGPVFAAILSSAIFGLLHYTAGSRGWLAVVFATTFGVAMCVLFQKTKSLYPGMAIHALHNSGVLVIAIITI